MTAGFFDSYLVVTVAVVVRDDPLTMEEDDAHQGGIAGRSSWSDVVRQSLGPAEEVSFPAKGESRGVRSETQPLSLLERSVAKVPRQAGEAAVSSHFCLYLSDNGSLRPG